MTTINGILAANSYYGQPYLNNNWGYSGDGVYYNNQPNVVRVKYPQQTNDNKCNCSHHTYHPHHSEQPKKNTAPTLAENFAKQSIKTTMDMVRSLEQKLNAMLANNEYSEEQKQQIYDNLDIVNQAEAELIDITVASEAPDISAGDLQAQINGIEKTLRPVLRAIGEISEPDPNALTKEEDADGDGIRDNATYSDDELILAERFYNSVTATGLFGIPCTDDDEFEAVCSELNKNNILGVMIAYHESHPGESFMEAFMWDADHGQKRDYGKQIRNVLFEKARELGVTKECANDFKEIDEELDDWCISNDISKNFDNIIGILAKASKQPYNASSRFACGALVGGAIGTVIGWFS